MDAKELGQFVVPTDVTPERLPGVLVQACLDLMDQRQRSLTTDGVLLTWIVLQYAINFDQPVVPGMTLNLSGLPYRRDHHVSLRTVYVTDQQQQRVVTIRSVWGLLNQSSRTLTRLDDAALGLPEGLPIRRVDRLHFPRITTAIGITRPVGLRPDDIDHNQHLHNTRYFDLAMGMLPPEQFQLYWCEQIDIRFRREIVAGDQPRIMTGRADSTVVVQRFCVDDNNVAELVTRWRRRDGNA
ncbi:acyl-ACP thioesterase domain-containing protein [Lacticaseibacillus pantheris]|nr:acyl-ACP thioesterase domain-containing protein [Lacticaseibacillus pantheris]